jgi:hypothetical protein
VATRSPARDLQLRPDAEGAAHHDLVLVWRSWCSSPEIRQNVWVGSNFYYTADTPGAKEFVKNYQAKFGNPPGYALCSLFDDTTAAGRLRQGQVRGGAGRGSKRWKASRSTTSSGACGWTRPRTRTSGRISMRCKQKEAMMHETDFADIISTGDARCRRNTRPARTFAASKF